MPAGDGISQPGGECSEPTCCAAPTGSAKRYDDHERCLPATEFRSLEASAASRLAARRRQAARRDTMTMSDACRRRNFAAWRRVQRADLLRGADRQREE